MRADRAAGPPLWLAPQCPSPGCALSLTRLPGLMPCRWGRLVPALLARCRRAAPPVVPALPAVAPRRPFQMDKGVPIDCTYFETEECSTSERWPGMWQVPVWWLTKDGSEDGEPYRCRAAACVACLACRALLPARAAARTQGACCGTTASKDTAACKGSVLLVGRAGACHAKCARSRSGMLLPV